MFGPIWADLVGSEPFIRTRWSEAVSLLFPPSTSLPALALVCQFSFPTCERADPSAKLVKGKGLPRLCVLLYFFFHLLARFVRNLAPWPVWNVVLFCTGRWFCSLNCGLFCSFSVLLIRLFHSLSVSRSCFDLLLLPDISDQIAYPCRIYWCLFWLHYLVALLNFHASCNGMIL